MCGIFGVIGKYNDILLHMMKSTLIHRGPDETGYFIDSKCALGINRLSIVDLKNGMQPAFSHDKSVVSVFNGEIYNFKELRIDLEKKGYIFQSDHSDAELIPALYLEYGTRFVDFINGMFAITIYDVKKNIFYLIRDRVGKKPLYYRLVNGDLFFSSEIKGIIEVTGKPDINLNSLADYLQNKNTIAPNTIYKEIKLLPPASILKFSNKRIVYTKKYWEVEFDDALANGTENYYTEILLEKLKNAVSIRTRTDVEFGCYLSGGLDSSLMVALLRDLGINKLKTFNLAYDESILGKNQDTYFAKLISQHFDTEHYQLEISSRKVFQSLPDILSSFDEPFSGTVSNYFVSSLISEHLKVAISGDGADELFGSYYTHRLSNPIEHVRSMPTILKFSELTKNDLLKIKPFDSEKGYKELLKLYSMKNWRNSFKVFQLYELKKFFNLNLTPKKQYSDIEIQNKEYKSGELNTTLECEFNNQLHNQVIAFMDRLSMSHSVEVRSPFLDFKFVEAASKIPRCLKINNGNTKYILKKIAEKYLPLELVHRKKEGFVMPNYYWISGEYNKHAKESILDSGMIESLGFSRTGIESLLKSNTKTNEFYAKFWNLYCLSVWFVYVFNKN